MAAPVRKAVFPVAGLGTRFLPASKAMPKEMLTVVDRPLIQHVVDEARASGHRAFHLRHRTQQERDRGSFRPPSRARADARRTRQDNRSSKRCSRDLPSSGQTSFVRQQEPLGLGHAVWCARELVGREPFALLLPDVLVQNRGKGCTAQMLDVYKEYGGNIIAVEPVPEAELQNYGVVSVGKGVGGGDRVFPTDGMVEKPKPGTAPSNFTILGRYILQPEIFDILSAKETGAGGEIQITDAMIRLMQTQPFYAYRYEGRSFDCGSKLGFLLANVAYALERPDLGDAFAAKLRKLLR